MKSIIATLLCAFPAHADTTHVWGYFPEYASTISLEPTSAPGAVAQVTFRNKTVHKDELVTFTLDLDGLAVEVTALVGRGMTPDRFSVEPPAGFIAVPPDLDVNEDEDGVILILPYVGF